eukprot:2131635-Rhodomonas_salina.1
MVAAFGGGALQASPRLGGSGKAGKCCSLRIGSGSMLRNALIVLVLGAGTTTSNLVPASRSDSLGSKFTASCFISSALPSSPYLSRSNLCTSKMPVLPVYAPRSRAVSPSVSTVMMSKKDKRYKLV